MTIFRILARNGYVKIAAVTAAISTIAILQGLSASLNASEWANWVQAVGSIVALGVAIFVMSRQNRHAAKLIADADRLSTLRRARSVHAILGRTLVRCQSVRPETEVFPDTPTKLSKLETHLQLSVESLTEIQKVLKAMPTYDLGSFDMANGVHSVIDAVDALHSSCVYLVQHPTDAGQQHVLERNTAVFKELKVGVLRFIKGMEDLEGEG